MKTKHHSILSAPVNPICRRWSALALGGFLFTSIFALSAPRVEAQCQQWNVGHGWQFKQGPTRVDLDLHQNGTVITGTATHDIQEKQDPGIIGKSHGIATVQGTVDGTVKGDRFAVIIHWDNNTTGVYNGTIGPSGRIEGTGYNQATPSQKVNWYSETHMECADAAPVAPKPDATKSTSAAADDWINQERSKRKTNNTYNANDPNRPKGFINGLQVATPTPSAEADESSSNDTEDQHGKHKKNKKKHHHHDDDQEQGND